MVDVSKIEGPSGPPEDAGKKSSQVDADKFKEAMKRRVAEVSQVDPDEQKKRKRQEEEEEETQAPVSGPTTPPEQVTPFSLETQQKGVSPLEMQKGGPGISPTESAQPTTPVPPGQAAAGVFAAPSSAEMSDDAGVLEEESFIESIPSAIGAQGAEEQPPPTLSAPPAQEAPPSQPPQAAPVGPPQTAQPPSPAGQLGAPSLPPVGPPETAPVTAGGLGTPVPPLTQTGTSAAALEETQAKKVEDTTGFFEQLGKEQPGQQGKTPEELAQEVAAVQGAGAAPPPGFTEALEGKEGKQVEGAGAAAQQGMAGPAAGVGEPLGAAAPPPAPEALPSYANMNPQVMELFDRMVGVITVMNMSGMSETVITLNAPQFASSVFFGSQIIIQEFSTAPQAFNIQLNGSPQAVALFQGNADDLMAAFQAGNYNFRVNRLETGYLPERPLFKRKERAGGEQQDQTGDHPS